MLDDDASGALGHLPEALRLLRLRAGVETPPAEVERWEQGGESPPLDALAAWLGELGCDFRSLQDALDLALARAAGDSLEPHPVEELWVAGRARLELDAGFREQVRALAEESGLGEVLRRLERLEQRLEKDRLARDPADQ